MSGKRTRTVAQNAVFWRERADVAAYDDFKAGRPSSCVTAPQAQVPPPPYKNRPTTKNAKPPGNDKLIVNEDMKIPYKKPGRMGSRRLGAVHRAPRTR